MAKKACPTITEERRHNGLVSFGADVRRLVAPVLGKNGFLHADILTHWDDITGGLLAKGVYPVKLAFPKGQKDGAVLHVKAVSGAYAVELIARQSEILERLNGYFGYRAVAEQLLARFPKASKVAITLRESISAVSSIPFSTPCPT